MTSSANGWTNSAPSAVTLAMSRPDPRPADTATASMRPASSGYVTFALPVPRSQTISRRSSPPLTRDLPSGANASPRAAAACPVRVSLRSPVAASQTWISLPPLDATVLPSGAKATFGTRSTLVGSAAVAACPRYVSSSRPFSTFQTLTVPSRDDVASRRPSGAKLMPVTRSAWRKWPPPKARATPAGSGAAGTGIARRASRNSRRACAAFPAALAARARAANSSAAARSAGPALASPRSLSNAATASGYGDPSTPGATPGAASATKQTPSRARGARVRGMSVSRGRSGRAGALSIPSPRPLRLAGTLLPPAAAQGRPSRLTPRVVFRLRRMRRRARRRGASRERCSSPTTRRAGSPRSRVACSG